MKLKGLSNESVKRIARVLKGQSDSGASLTEENVEDLDVVKDPNTGLIWEKDYASGVTWDEAMKRPEELNAKEVGGFSDWRLPTQYEIRRLGLTTLSGIGDWFWTDFISADGYDLVRYEILGGGVGGFIHRKDRINVRCIRG